MSLVFVGEVASLPPAPDLPKVLIRAYRVRTNNHSITKTALQFFREQSKKSKSGTGFNEEAYIIFNNERLVKIISGLTCLLGENYPERIPKTVYADDYKSYLTITQWQRHHHVSVGIFAVTNQLTDHWGGVNYLGGLDRDYYLGGGTFLRTDLLPLVQLLFKALSVHPMLLQA